MARVSGATDESGALTRLGELIRECRRERHLSQEALADAAGIDRSHMGKIERGERNVTLFNLLRIAAALGQQPSDLLSRAGL
jgi:transcriptional regulator with XRE-family HTH domain